MNFIHLHIILVHFPVVLVPVASLVLLGTLLRKCSKGYLLANGLLLFGSSVGVAAYFIGEEAEEAIENLSGFSKGLIEAHAMAAEYAIWFLAAIAILSLINIVLERLMSPFARACGFVLVVLGLFTSTVLAMTAQKGGMIRHPEAFTPEEIQASEAIGLKAEENEH